MVVIRGVSVALLLSLFAIVPGAGAADCDGNGVPDDQDVVLSYARHSIAAPAAATLSGIDAADFDLDGDLDAVYATAGDNFSAFAQTYWRANSDGEGALGAELTLGDFAGAPLVVADLDGDGVVDLVGADTVTNLLSWFRNLGGGVVGPRQIIDQGPDYTSLVAVDLDGDDDLDLLAASGSADVVQWFRNDLTGSGTFSSAIVVTTTLVDPVAAAAADVDGDGDDDVLAVSSGDDSVAWFENDGSGAFGPAQTVSTIVGSDPSSLFPVDLDGDGDEDLVVSSSGDDTVGWYANLDGMGGFGPRQSIDGQLSGARSAIAADLDGDGDADVVGASIDAVVFYENAGTGSFGPAGIVDDGPGVQLPRGLVAAHVDSDTAVDLLVVFESAGYGAAWYESFGGNDCNGNDVPDSCDLTSGTSPDCDANGIPDECQSDCNDNGVPDGCDVSGGASSDCDADGFPDECQPDCNDNGVPDTCDLSSGSSDDCDANGLPDECQPDCNANGVFDDCDVSSGTSDDCDANGLPDECQEDCNANDTLDSCDIFGGTSVDCDVNGIPDECEPDCNGNGVTDACDLLGESGDCNTNSIPDECEIGCEGGVEACFLVEIGWEPQPPITFGQKLAAADMDGDGDVDAVVTSFGELRVVFNQDGLGTFVPGPKTPDGPGFLRTPIPVDLDGDADLDVLVFTQTAVAWYENADGLGALGPRQELFAAGDVNSADAADLDGDGDRDVLIAWQPPLGGQIGRVVWLPNLGGGSFGAQRQITNTTEALGIARALDLDDDGDADVIAGSELGWFENDGTGSFGTFQLIDSWFGFPQDLILADLDADGDSDLFARWSGFLYWYRDDTGQGDFGTRRVIYEDLGSLYPPLVTAADLADVDIDGDLDLFMASSEYNPDFGWEGSYFSVREHLGSGQFGSFFPNYYTFAAESGGGEVVARHDLDGDGLVDPLVIVTPDAALSWSKRLTNDCNADGQLDQCEADCNANAQADTCEILTGLQLDCDANGVLDSCETGCGASCDVDGDGQTVTLCDCDDTNGAIWASPSPAEALTLDRIGRNTLLQWGPPAAPGAVSVVYDTLRSATASDFTTELFCLDPAASDVVSTETETPPAGGVFHYLIRVDNDCPGTGTAGTNSSGMPRSTGECT